MLIYNRDMFGKAGVTPPAEGWTWDELIAACKQIQTVAPTVTCLGPWSAGAAWSWYPWVRGYGGDVLSAKGTQSTFHSPETTAGLRAYTELWTKHHIMQQPGQEAIDCFRAGQCAATGSNLGYWKGLLQSAGQLGFEPGVQRMPQFPKGRFDYAVVVELGIAKASKHPQQAWKFLKYMLSPSAQGQVVQLGLGVPVLKSTPHVPAGYGAFVEALASAVYGPYYPSACGSVLLAGMGDAQSVTSSTVVNVIKGLDTLENGLKLIDSRINSCLAGAK